MAVVSPFQGREMGSNFFSHQIRAAYHCCPFRGNRGRGGTPQVKDLEKLPTHLERAFPLWEHPSPAEARAYPTVCGHRDETEITSKEVVKMENSNHSAGASE